MKKRIIPKVIVIIVASAGIVCLWVRLLSTSIYPYPVFQGIIFTIVILLSVWMTFGFPKVRK